ncbi:MAG: hypothetical protein NVSMB9_25240 [Isosphaeraceae bacterium]
METLRTPGVLWKVRRLAVSAFLVLHLGATLIYVMPPCPVRNHCFEAVCYYILPLGLWQSWAMFAPDPVRDTWTLEADVMDARGMRHTFAFPRLGDYSTWQGIPRFRHSKFAANLSIPDLRLQREFTARHVVRALKLPGEAFPVDVHLLYQVQVTPPPGAPPAETWIAPQPYEIGSFRFASLDQVRP